MMTTEQRRSTQSVYINNRCALPCECHSVIEVASDEEYSRRDKVNALLWYLAKADKYQFATYVFKGGIEWANNIRMKSQKIPKRLVPIVAMWAKKMDMTAEEILSERKEQDMEEFVVQGLNTVFDELTKKWGNIDPQLFIKEVTHYSNRWARDCYQDAPHVY